MYFKGLEARDQRTGLGHFLSKGEFKVTERSSLVNCN